MGSRLKHNHTICCIDPGSRPPTLPVALTLNAACPPQARNDDAGAVVGVGLNKNHGQLLGRWVKHVGASEYLVQGLYTRPCVHSHRLSLSLGTTGGFCMVHGAEAGTVPRRALLQQGGTPPAGWHTLSYWIARSFAQSPAVHSDAVRTSWWDSMGGGDHHTTADPCDVTATACYLVCNQQYIDCLDDPANCITLYAAHTRPVAGW
jgi:hypothetical protein